MNAATTWGIAGGRRLLAKQRAPPFVDVQTVGIDAVPVRTASTIYDANEWTQEGRPANPFTVGSRQGCGHRPPAEGMRLGRLHDLVADERTGDVVALKVTTGRHGARLTRPALVHAIGNLQPTNDVVVTPEEIAGTRRE